MARRNVTNENDLAAQVLGFYAGAQELKSMLDAHLKSAKSDDQAFLAAKKAADDKTVKPELNAYLSGTWRYAVVVTAPASCSTEDKKDCDLPFGANFVEIGPPLCDGKVNTSGKCGDGVSPSGHTYRGDPGKETFSPGELITQNTDSIPSKKMIPLVDNGVLRAVLQGNDSTALGAAVRQAPARDLGAREEANHRREQARVLAADAVEQGRALHVLPVGERAPTRRRGSARPWPVLALPLR